METRMEKTAKSKVVVVLGISTAILAVVAFLLAIFSFLMLLERDASRRLLEKLSLARPGVKLADIKESLGTPMGEYQTLEKIIMYGPVQDEQFCRGKCMQSFYAVTPNCRAIDVYTDANGIIIYATWHDL
jgi:hypothetical protein